MKKLILLPLLFIASISLTNAQTALDFDGSTQWVDMGSFPALNNFTVEFDIQHNGADATYDRFLSNTLNGFSMATDASGNVRFYSNDLGIGWTLMGYTMPLNTWQHMAWVYDGVNISQAI